MQLDQYIRTILLTHLAIALTACNARQDIPPAISSNLFNTPEQVQINGYDGNLMEPFLTRDGHYLLFNNSNAPDVDTNIYYAKRINDTTFEFKGEVPGLNSSLLDGVASLDRNNLLYFISLRSYGTTLSTIYRSKFADGHTTKPLLVDGISKHKPGLVDFDAEISADGNTLYFAEGEFSGALPNTADILFAERKNDAFIRTDAAQKIMQNINTNALEYAPCTSADGLQLFFTRANTGFAGGTAIYVALREAVDKPFGAPARLAAIDGFVEATTISADEKSLYYHKKVGDKFKLYRVVKKSTLP